MKYTFVIIIYTYYIQHYKYSHALPVIFSLYLDFWQ